MIRLVHYLRKYLHAPPIKPPASEFRISDICFHSTTFKKPCFPMVVGILNANRTPPAARIPPIEYTADDRSSRKVKFLCSFGGKLMPCQIDGALSYVGGLTRIIAFRRDATFNELCSKMEDAYGGPVLIYYQLPDEGLDTLFSVSCVEDMENMMQEYDCLSQASGDGSAMLRVFLSSPVDMESDAESSDSGPVYGKVVNIAPAFEANPREVHQEAKTKSDTFKLHSDAGGDGFINEGTSTTIFFDPSKFVENDNNPELEYARFPAHLTVDCTTNVANVATQTVNLPSVGNDVPSTSKGPLQDTERYCLDLLHTPPKEHGKRFEKFQMRQKEPFSLDYFGANRANLTPMQILEEDACNVFWSFTICSNNLVQRRSTSFAIPFVNNLQLHHVTSLQQQQQLSQERILKRTDVYSLFSNQDPWKVIGYKRPNASAIFNNE